MKITELIPTRDLTNYLRKDVDYKYMTDKFAQFNTAWVVIVTDSLGCDYLRVHAEVENYEKPSLYWDRLFFKVKGKLDFEDFAQKIGAKVFNQKQDNKIYLVKDKIAFLKEITGINSNEKLNEVIKFIKK